MPTIRDGRGQLTVHDMGVPPAANPSGPVQRVTGDTPTAAPARSIGRERDPELMAESRSRGGQVHAAIVSQAKPIVSKAGQRSTAINALTGRQAQVVEALQRLGTRRAVVKELGIVYQSVDIHLENAAKKGLLPAGLPDLPRRIQGRESATATVPTRQEPPAPPEPAQPAPPATAEPERPPPLQPGLPCVSCSHATVCSIRPELEAWHATLERPLSPLVAITIVDARVEVACEHYLAAAS